MTEGGAGDEALIREQIAFYRRVTPHEPSGAAAFTDEVMARCPASRHCLELASGGGRWTQPLLERCRRITAVDASPERHALSRSRLADPRVDYVVADLFSFRPAERYDLVFAGAWLSHVPPARFESFWAMVADALLPDGRVVMFDDGIVGADGVVTYASDPSGGGAQRRLPDGREFTIVKVPYDPDELEGRLGALGWNATVTCLSEAVYVLVAHR